MTVAYFSPYFLLYYFLAFLVPSIHPISTPCILWFILKEDLFSLIVNNNALPPGSSIINVASRPVSHIMQTELLTDAERMKHPEMISALLWTPLSCIPVSLISAEVSVFVCCFYSLKAFAM